MIGFEWKIAIRYIKGRRDSVISIVAWASFLSITLGVATLITVMAVMTGFRYDLIDRLLGVNGHAIVHLMKTDHANELVNNITNIEDVIRATPFVNGFVMLTSDKEAEGLVIRGIRQDVLETLPLLKKNIISGHLSDISQGEHIVIGEKLAQRHHLKIGDVVSLISPQGNATPFGDAPNIQSYTIAAIFNIGLSSYDSNFIFTNLQQVSELLGEANITTKIEIFVKNPDEIEMMTEKFRKAVGEESYIINWKQQYRTMENALQVEQNVMFFILTLILLIASLNIISGLVMLVKDKYRDIAILRTMGATRHSMLKIFMITGSSIGIMGTLSGFFLGWFLCENIESIRQILSWISGQELFPAEIYFLRDLPAKMVPSKVLLIVSTALGLSLLSTLYPAWRAASLDPAKVFRNE